MALNASYGQPLGTRHPSAADYIRIAVILLVLTALEVTVWYLQPIRDLNLMAPILLLLAAAKFLTVIGYYMHLRFDHRIFSFFFATGITLACFAILVLMALFGVLDRTGSPFHSLSTQAALAAASSAPSATAPATVDPASIGSVTNGKALFVAKGCTGCHMAPGVPGSATVGPNQAHYAVRAKTAGGTLPNTPANTEKWLTNPPAIKPGTDMPNLGLSQAEIKDLTAFLYSLK